MTPCLHSISLTTVPQTLLDLNHVMYQYFADAKTKVQISFTPLCQYTDSMILLLSKSKISSLQQFSVLVHLGLCQTTLKVFIATQLICIFFFSHSCILSKYYEYYNMKLVFQFLTRPDTNQSVQTQMKARSLKFWIYKDKGLSYL